jgi:phospholipid-binding lipoprotein MlaA
VLGVAGLFDVAARDFNLPEHQEDLGQTLGHWGVGEGWYLMLPLLGPSTNRDLVGRLGDVSFSLLSHVELDYDERLALGVINAVDTRAQYLGADKVLEDSLDPYAFVRTAYLQRRQASVQDGKPPEHSTPDYDITVQEAPLMDDVMNEAPWQR